MSVSAVLTADIVKFTRLSPVLKKRMIAKLAVVLKKYKFEFYRGDSLQVYIKNPGEALELAFRLRSVARSFSFVNDVRVSIGIGKVVTQPRTLRTATGEAFVLSGRAFDQLKGGQNLWIQSSNENANIAFRVIGYYSDSIFRRLTSKQSEVVTELLNENTQIQAAKKLKKAQATVNKHAQAAGWAEIEKLISEYKQVINQFNLS